VRTGRFPPVRLVFALAGVALALVAFGLVAVLGQGGKLGNPQPSPTPSSVQGTPIPVTVMTSGDVNVTDAANGQTVTIAQGHTLTVTLGSTYWMFNGSSNPAVLQQEGQATYKSGICAPGIGCGTATMRFRTIAPGRADVTASRTSCGEALACGPLEGSFRITVVVTA
jgi:hypothetical protein